MTKISSAKVAKATNNITTNSSLSSSGNPSSNTVISRSELISNTSEDDDNNISTAHKSIQQQSQVVTRQVSNTNTNINHEDDFETTSNVSYKRKQAPTKNMNNKKIPKISVNNTTTTSSITIISDVVDDDNYDDDNDNDNIDVQQVKEPSAIWQFAIRSNDRSYANCLLCNKRISTANWSTTSVRRHLVQVHNKTELILSNEEKRENPYKIGRELKEKLHELSVEAIIRDNLPFNAFNKLGLSKLIQEAVPGRKEFLLYIFYTKKVVPD